LVGPVAELNYLKIALPRCHRGADTTNDNTGSQTK
jgi:hypothetical protein